MMYNYSCSICGEHFTFSQELSRHVRDKKCQIKVTTTQASDVEQISYHTMKILPTYTIIVPTQSLTSCQSVSASGIATATTDVVLSIPSAQIVDSRCITTVPQKATDDVEGSDKPKIIKDSWRCGQCDFK